MADGSGWDSASQDSLSAAGGVWNAEKSSGGSTPGQRIRLVLGLGDPERERRLLSAFDEANGFVPVGRCLSADELLPQLESDRVDAALVAFDLHHLTRSLIARALQHVRRLVLLTSDRPADVDWAALGVIALPVNASPAQVVEALRGGMPVIAASAPSAAAPIVAPEVRESESAKKTPAESVLLAITGHGSPGRTMIAVNLASCLGSVARTVLVDLDLTGPSVAAYLSADPTQNIYMVAYAAPRSAVEWDLALEKELQPIGPGSASGHVLCGMPKPEMRARLSASFVAQLLDQLGQRYRYVVIDAGADLGEASGEVGLEAVRRADRVLLVAAPDLVGSAHVERALLMAKRQVANRGERVAVVVNRHHRGHDAKRHDLELALDAGLAAIVPDDYRAAAHALARTEDINKRPAFRELLAAATAQQIDVIIVHKLDRFSRNLRITLESLEKLAKANVTFVSICENMDYSTPMGRVFLALVGAFAQYYSDNLSHETKKGWRERKEQGLYGGALPFGVMKGPDGVPAPDTRPISLTGGPSTNYEGLLLAFRQCGLGLTDVQIARLLNEAGYRPITNDVRERRERVAQMRDEGMNADAIASALAVDPRAIKRDMAALEFGPASEGSRSRFTKDTVRTILVNRFYIGELPLGNRQWMAARHAPLVDAELWQAAQQERARKRSSPLTVPGRASVWSLTGLARCDGCGGKMHAYLAGGRRSRLACYTRYQTGDCHQRSVLLDAIEADIEQHLTDFHVPVDFQRRILAMQRDHGSADAGSRREKLEARLVRLQKLYEWGDKSEAEYLTEREAVQRDLAQLRPSLAKSDQLARLKDFLSSVALAWREATQQQRNRLLRTIYMDIYIRDQRVVSVRPRPELEPFFQLDCHEKGCTGGPEGIPSRESHLRPGCFAVMSALPLSPVEMLVAEHIRSGPSKTLRQLARECGTSHETVRRAIQQLAAKAN